MRLLIKLPSRSRPDKLVAITSKYVEYSDDMDKTNFVISLDSDDKTVTPELVLNLKSIHKNIEVVVGSSTSKIHAINRDIPDPSTFDILLLASDDMNPIERGYDKIIREKMTLHYPDTDGVLFFNDGFNNEKLNTLVICGSKYYQRFNYIYYPGYMSLFCDNEFMDVANRLGKQTYFDKVIIRHEHPITDKTVEVDELYARNDKFFKRDRLLYVQRLHNRRQKINSLITF